MKIISPSHAQDASPGLYNNSTSIHYIMSMQMRMTQRSSNNPRKNSNINMEQKQIIDFLRYQTRCGSFITN